MRANKQSQIGVTLVELMIGLTIGLIVTGGATTILLSNQKMLVEKQYSDRQQEEFRFAIDTLTRLIRQSLSFGKPSSDDELIVNFDRNQRDCIGESGPTGSTTNFLRVVDDKLICVRDVDPDKTYVLAKNIGNLQFSYGVQSAGAVQYCLYSSTSCPTTNYDWAKVFSSISSIKTQISLVKTGQTLQPTLSFVATSHTNSTIGNMSSGEVVVPTLTETNTSNTTSTASTTSSTNTNTNTGTASSTSPTNQTGSDPNSLPTCTKSQVESGLKVKYDGNNVAWSTLLIGTVPVTKGSLVEVTYENVNNCKMTGWSLNTNSIANTGSWSFTMPNAKKGTLKLVLRYGSAIQDTITLTNK